MTVLYFCVGVVFLPSVCAGLVTSSPAFSTNHFARACWYVFGTSRSLLALLQALFIDLENGYRGMLLLQ